MSTPGRLTLDFGDVWTVVACWYPEEKRARPLELPGFSQPAGFAIPSLAFYPDPQGKPFIGWQAKMSSTDAAPELFQHLQAEVIAGKRDYRDLAGEPPRRISRRDAARDFVAMVLEAAAATLSLTPAELPAVTVVAPAAVMETAIAWQHYREFIAWVAATVGLRRWRLVESPWASAWGSGLELRPGGAYGVIHAEAAAWEAMIVRVADRLPDDDQERRLRLLIRTTAGWAQRETEPGVGEEYFQQGELVVRRVRRRLRELGLSDQDLQGMVVTGCDAEGREVRSWLREQFPQLPLYDGCPSVAAACGAATLTAGVESCGYIRHEYALRYWDEGEGDYRYRTVVPAGSFFPSRAPLTKLPVKVSYPGQKQISLVVCRMPESRWQRAPLAEGLNAAVSVEASRDFPAGSAEIVLNEKDRFLIPVPVDAIPGCWEAEMTFGIDSSRILTVTIRHPETQDLMMDAAPVIRLI